MDHQHGTRRNSVATLDLVRSDADAGPIVYQAFHLDRYGIVEVRRNEAFVYAFDNKGNSAAFQLFPDDRGLRIELLDLTENTTNAWRLASAVFEYLFSTDPPLPRIILHGDKWSKLQIELARNGIAFSVKSASDDTVLHADMFWQTSSFWTQPASNLFPRREIFDGKIAHPLRPPKPVGTLYARYIPWLHGVFSLDVATLSDLPDVHRWMNDPRVDEFWHEAGDEERHRRYLQGMFADPHIMPLIGRFDGEAFAYFEVYWAKEDVVGTFCDATDYDRGCHVIVGKEACRGQKWFTAWLPSLIHFMFLDDPRTERLVQEPSVLHHRQLRNLQKSGFSHLKSVDLPTKRAAIMSITRHRFFSDHLWHPGG